MEKMTRSIVEFNRHTNHIALILENGELFFVKKSMTKAKWTPKGFVYGDESEVISKHSLDEIDLCIPKSVKIPNGEVVENMVHTKKGNTVYSQVETRKYNINEIADIKEYVLTSIMFNQTRQVNDELIKLSRYYKIH